MIYSRTKTVLPTNTYLLDWTSPVFFWTNIELSLAVVSACLPTLRPIWTKFRPAKHHGGYTYGYNTKESNVSSERHLRAPNSTKRSAKAFNPLKSTEDDLDAIPMVERPAKLGRCEEQIDGIRVEHHVDIETAPGVPSHGRQNSLPVIAL